MVLQVLGQLSGEHVHILRHDHQLGTGKHGAVDVENGIIEIEGGLAGHDRLRIKAEPLHHPMGIVDDTDVGDGDTLRHAGGAGGIHNVDGVRIRHPGKALCQSSGIGLTGQQVLEAEDRDIREGPGQLALLRPVADQRTGIQVVEHLLQSGQGRSHVHGNIGAAGKHGTHKGTQGIGRFGQHHDHRGAAQILLDQSGTDPLRPLKVLRIGQKDISVLQSDTVCIPDSRPLQHTHCAV